MIYISSSSYILVQGDQIIHVNVCNFALFSRLHDKEIAIYQHMGPITKYLLLKDIVYLIKNVQ